MVLNEEQRARLARLDRAVAAMDSPMREGFLMHRLESMGYPEIGERLGLSVFDVQRNIAGAMLHLARAMDEAEGGAGGLTGPDPIGLAIPVPTATD